MSDLMGQLRHGIDLRVERASAMLDQATFGPVALRVSIVAAALAGFAVCWPLHPLFTALVIVPVGLALCAGLFPRTGLPTVAIVAIVGGYLGNIATGGSLTTWRTIVAAGLIYIVHTGAAFAAVLPFNAVVTAGLFRPYVLRIATVIVITAVLALGVLAAPDVIGDHRLVIAAVAGMAAMVGVAGYVAYLGQRRH
jgi:hypothetical protein